MSNTVMVRRNEVRAVLAALSDTQIDCLSQDIQSFYRSKSKPETNGEANARRERGQLGIIEVDGM